jgi:hypothetical protein
MVADIIFQKNGVSAIIIEEIKSGNARLSNQQIEKLAEAARSGNIYIVNEAAAKELGIEPRVTFAAQKKIPLVYIRGGNLDTIAKQMQNQGMDVVPEGVGGGRGGRPAGWRVGGARPL